MDSFIVILVHQILFQGMFLIKNVTLSKKLGTTIRGNNREAVISTIFFALTIIIALVISYLGITYGTLHLINSDLAIFIGFVGMAVSIVISSASLVGLKDSWRVGIIEEQRTKLVTTGIYKYSRNPYFSSYLMVFLSYTVLLQNIFILVCLIIAFFLVHKMIIKEEKHLYAIHGESYLAYKDSTPRYLVI